MSPGLLVSVRDAQEAESALVGGATIIDVKEPAHGSLGAASVSRWLEIIGVVRDQVPLSVALGELLDDNLPLRLSELPPVDFAKVGLAGCGRLHDWPSRLRNVWQQFPRGVTPVAVIYADWQHAAAPSPPAVLRHAIQLHARVALWDTHDKTNGSLFDHLTTDELARQLNQARTAGLWTALAGSLSLTHLASVAALAPDILAVRGAVCGGERIAAVQRSRVAELVNALATATSAGARPNRCQPPHGEFPSFA